MAAYTPQESSQSLGALESGEHLTLATIDGEDDLVDMPTPPGGFLVAQGVAEGTNPANPFAPPDESTGNEISLAVVSLPEPEAPAAPAPAPAPASAPLAARDEAQPPLPTPRVKQRVQRPPLSVQFLHLVSDILSSERKHYAVGVLLVALVGFMPVHLIAGMWEGASYGEIKADLNRSYLDNIDRGEGALSSLRASAVVDLRSKRRVIVIVSSLLWLCACAALSWVWFRVIDWQAVRQRVELRQRSRGVV